MKTIRNLCFQKNKHYLKFIKIPKKTVKRSTLIKKILVFTIIFTVGILFLYTIHFIWVISVLILLGISLVISGIPSERIAPYPADTAVYYVQKIKKLFKKSDSGKFQKI